MSVFKRLIWVGHDRKLPTEIYTSLVASLFSDARTLLVGAAGSMASAVITAWKTGEPSLIVCAIGIIGISLARAADMQHLISSSVRRRHQAGGPLPQSSESC